jgi:hypothetical protein
VEIRPARSDDLEALLARPAAARAASPNPAGAIQLYERLGFAVDRREQLRALAL